MMDLAIVAIVVIKLMVFKPGPFNKPYKKEVQGF